MSWVRRLCAPLLKDSNVCPCCSLNVSPKFMCWKLNRMLVVFGGEAFVRSLAFDKVVKEGSSAQHHCLNEEKERLELAHWLCLPMICPLQYYCAADTKQMPVPQEPGITETSILYKSPSLGYFDIATENELRQFVWESLLQLLHREHPETSLLAREAALAKRLTRIRTACKWRHLSSSLSHLILDLSRRCRQEAPQRWPQ